MNEKEFFYKNGIYFKNREIVIGTNSFSESDEISHLDLFDLRKSLIIMNENLTGDDKKDAVNISFCSSGGDIYIGFGIYDLIKSQNYTINITAFGRCMSAALLILQGGDNRFCYQHTSFMIHGVETVIGDIKTLSHTEREIESTECDRLENLMLEIFAKNTKLKKTEISELIEKDTHFDANEALEWGFIDKII